MARNIPPKLRAQPAPRMLPRILRVGPSAQCRLVRRLDPELIREQLANPTQLPPSLAMLTSSPHDHRGVAA